MLIVVKLKYVNSNNISDTYDKLYFTINKPNSTLPQLIQNKPNNTQGLQCLKPVTRPTVTGA